MRSAESFMRYTPDWSGKCLICSFRASCKSDIPQPDSADNIQRYGLQNQYRGTTRTLYQFFDWCTEISAMIQGDFFGIVIRNDEETE